MNRKTSALLLSAFWLSVAAAPAGAVESHDDALKSLNRGTIEDSLSSPGRGSLDETLEPEFLELDTLRAAAAEGDPEAHFRLGLAYENDRFWTPDYDKAFFHFKAAADAGYPAANGPWGNTTSSVWGRNGTWKRPSGFIRMLPITVTTGAGCGSAPCT